MPKYIIIGAGGIGNAIARRLKEQGADLHLVSRNPDAAAAELGASSAKADVTQPAQLEEAIKLGGSAIDGLCYAVGTITIKPLHRLTDDDARHDFELNALGAFRSLRAALPALKASQQATSSVLLFSTVAVAQGFASHASISMAKGAIEGLVAAAGAELAPKVRVNAIAPSLIRTPLAQQLTSNQTVAESIAAMHAVPRLGEPEDIASLAALLLSEQAGWITGQVIGVDGGRAALRTKG